MADIKRLPNDLTHVAALLLVLVCGAATVAALAMFLATIIAPQVASEIARMAAEHGKSAPVGNDVNGFLGWALGCSALALASGFGARLLWRRAQARAPS